MGDIPESLLQLGVAASISIYLVWFLTKELKRSIDVNTNTLISLSLIQTEMFKTMLVMDASLRGVYEGNPALTGNGKQAHAIYTQVLDRVTALQTQIANLKQNGN